MQTLEKPMEQQIDACITLALIAIILAGTIAIITDERNRHQ